MNDVGRADAHALTAFNAARQKLFFKHGPGGANKARFPVVGKVTVEAH